MNTKKTVKRMIDLYKNKFYSAEYLSVEYPQLAVIEVKFILQQHGITIRSKKEASEARKKKVRLDAEKIRPTKNQLRTLFGQYRTLPRLHVYYFKTKGVTLKILAEWLSEEGLSKRSMSKFLSPKQRLKNILNKLEN